jgi:hypothetical protein
VVVFGWVFEMSGDAGWKKFVFGGASGCLATLVVQPLDLIKTRMQLTG